MNDNLYFVKRQIDNFIEQHSKYNFVRIFIKDMKNHFVQKSDILTYLPFENWCDRNNIKTISFEKYASISDNDYSFWISASYPNLFVVVIRNSEYVVFTCKDGTEILSVLDDI